MVPSLSLLFSKEGVYVTGYQWGSFVTIMEAMDKSGGKVNRGHVCKTFSTMFGT